MGEKAIRILGNPLEVQAIIKSLIYRFGCKATLESVLVNYQTEELSFC